MLSRGDLTDDEWAVSEPLLPKSNNRCGRWRVKSTGTSTSTPPRSALTCTPPERHRHRRHPVGHIKGGQRKDQLTCARTCICGRSWRRRCGRRGSRSLARRADDEAAPERGRQAPAAVAGHHTRAVGRLYAVRSGHGQDLCSSAGPGSASPKARQCGCRQGIQQPQTRTYLRERGIRHVIPEKRHQTAGRLRRGSRGRRPPGLDKDRYKKRNTVERAINKLKQFRAVATRYDKRYVFLGTVTAAALLIWLRS